MSTSTSRAEIAATLHMRMPEGASLRVHGVDLAVSTEDEVLRECLLTLEVPQEVYVSLAMRGLFHLAPDNRGPGAETFEPNGPVRIEARLDPGLHAELELLGGEPETVAKAIVRSSNDGKWTPLLDTEAWYAIHVTALVHQDIDSEGELRIGYSTIFATRMPEASGGEPLHLPLLAQITQVLDERGIDWAETTDDEVIEAEIGGENGTWTCYLVAREAEQRVSVYSQAPWYAPEPNRGAMAELLTRINYGLSIGNFEMDFADGEIRFKTSLDVSGDRMSTELLTNLFEPNFAAMDTYLPALEAVRDARLSPPEAAASVEDSLG